jgi:hypothetical protein
MTRQNYYARRHLRRRREVDAELVVGVTPQLPPEGTDQDESSLKRAS